MVYTGLEMDVNSYSSHLFSSRVLHSREAVFSALKQHKYFS
jgi:hypothetical protein